MIFTSRELSSGAKGAYGARPSRRIEWRLAPKSLTTSIIEIDISLTDIVIQRHGNGLEGLSVRRPSSVVDYAIEGVVRGAAASAIEDEGASDPRLVYISGYTESDRMDRDEDFDPRSVCYIVTDRGSDYVWRTNIYIERYIFSRLVELYASKRIDCAKISILLKVLRDPSGAIDLPTSSHPMLRTVGDRRRRHSRAHLISVLTMLGAAAQVHPAIAAHSAAWGNRIGRRQAPVPQL
jgi:hypothetical protein